MTESVTVNKKRIKQITQTQEDILTAFGQLLEEYPYEKIQISQIAKKSGYARRTFYRHFDSRDDLLTLFIERLTLNLFSNLVNWSNLLLAKFSKIFLVIGLIINPFFSFLERMTYSLNFNNPGSDILI